jgi:NTP pyrophosphatase (non-canonical NTP hydrolase)
MDSKTYLKEVLRTESIDFPAIKERLNHEGTLRLLHAGIGLATETGEFLDSIKKEIFYGKEPDWTNLMEELGDLHWYIAVAQDALGITTEEIYDMNIKKLKSRYPGKFTKENALNRNLKEERKILESRQNDH